MFERIRAFFEPVETESVNNTQMLLERLEKLFRKLSNDFNSGVAEEPLKLSVRKISASGEDNEQAEHERLLVSTAIWALSIRAHLADNFIECFVLPSTELTSLLENETPSRLKLKLTQDQQVKTEWLMDGLNVNDTELETLMRSLVKDVIERSRGDFELMPESMRLVYGGVSLTRSVRGLVADKHQLMQKIVNQQESILAAVARDIHDAVLGNVMILQRSVSGASPMSQEETEKVIADISKRLREICHDLYPRDLKDCGLKPLLEELCRDYQRRTGCSITFDCSSELPDLADEVLLHIYRIAQECFNNIGKHASASNVSLAITVDDGKLTMKIHDDGKGIVDDSHRDNRTNGGSGLSIIRERTELIDCIYPTRVAFQTEPDRGTCLTLEIVFASP